MSASSTLPPGLAADGAAELVRLIDALDLLDRLWQLPDAGGEPGDVPVGRFRARCRVGAGRFGVVFRADDPGLGRAVVVKVPQPAVLADPELRERFVREARAAGRLDHPGVVPVFEAGDDHGLPYLAATFVAGPTLAAWLAARTSPPPPVVVAQLAERLAAALHHAHERGVLHCDLKPANVLLDGEAAPPGTDDARHAVEVGPGEFVRPRLTDFGLARLVEDDPALTHTYQVAGTPLYMAPEQARGDRRSLMSRTDVYALGAILYELLTGRPPFAGGSEAEVRARLLTDPPADPARRPGVSRDLAAVALKCLEKDPARRYDSAADLAADLRRFLAGRPVRARRVGPVVHALRAVRRRPGVTALAAGAVLLAGALGGLLIRQGYVRLELREAERTAAVAGFHGRLAAVRERRANPPYPGWAADSLADLRELAAAPAAADHRAALRTEAVAALAALDLRPVRTVEIGFAAYCPTFSPDGGTLAVASWRAGPDGAGHVRLFDPATGAARATLAVPLLSGWDAEDNRGDGCRSIEYDPAGRWLVVGTRSGRLVRWDATNPAEATVWAAHADDPVPPPRRAVNGLTFADGGRELFSSTSVTVRRWDAAAGWAPAGAWSDATGPVGTRLFAAEPVLQFGPVGGDRRFGRPGPDGTRMGPAGSAVFGSSFAVAPGGRLVAFITGLDHDLALAPLHPGGGPQPFVVPGRPRGLRVPMYDAEFNAGAAVLATSGEHDRRVRVWDVAAGALAADRVVGEGSGRLAFAPDGRTLAVAEGERVVLYELTGGVRETLGAGPWLDLGGFAAAPDGRTVTTFHRTGDFTTEVATWTEPGEKAATRVVPETLTDSHVADAAPDGRTVAFVQCVEKGERVFAGADAGPETERVTDLRFGPDGRLWATDAHRVRTWTLPGWAEGRPLTNDADADAGGMVFRAVAPGRTVTLVGRRDGRVFRLPGGASWQPFPAPVTALALAADESRVVVGGEGGEVVLIELPGGTARAIPRAHRDAVRAAAFGPGGWLVTGSADGTVKVWAADGSPLLTVATGGGVRKLALSRDGTRLTVQVEGERAVRRWRLDALRAGLAALGLDWAP